MPVADGKMAQDTLCRVTGIGDYELARQNWDLVDILMEEHPDFSPTCELCHAENLLTDYVIEHGPSGAVLKVGSVCIKRFVLMTGTRTAEETQAVMERRGMQLGLRTPLQLLVLDILMEPVEGRKLDQFRRQTAEYFGLRVSELKHLQTMSHYSELWRRYLSDLGIANDNRAIERVRLALYEPRKLNPRVSLASAKPEPWQKRVARVRTTLARSAAYKDPSKQIK